MKKTFKDLFIEQLNRCTNRFEIEYHSSNTIYVWDNQEEHSMYYVFDDEGNLKDIY